MQENIFEIESLDTATSVARSAATAGLSFTNAGNNLVYCDNPEFYTLYSNGMECTVTGVQASEPHIRMWRCT